MKSACILCLFSLAVAAFGQPWDIQCPLPTAAAMYEVTFLDAATGFVSVDGGILRTSDGGQAWSQVWSGTGHPQSFGFTDAAHGWAGGMNDLLLRTTDGGRSWAPVQVWPHLRVTSICFTSPANGWLIGSPVLHTVNGGLTWDSVRVFSDPALAENGFFLDSLNGWMTTYDWLSYVQTLYHTADGGVTWDSAPLDSSRAATGLWFATPDRGFMTTVDYVEVGDDDWGIVASSLFGTDFGGSSWDRQFSDSNMTFSTIRSQDANHACVCGHGAFYCATGDRGLTWQRRDTDPELSWSAVGPAGPQGYVAVGTHSVIVRSDDHGATWEQISGGMCSQEWTSVAVADARHAWVAGGRDNFLRTTDGGNQWWVNRIPAEVQVITDLAGADSLSVWASASLRNGGGAVYRSVDGGLHWTQRLARSTAITGLSFPDPLHGWAINEDSIYRTTDGGNHWTAETGSDFCQEIFFLDSLHGWACGMQHWINHTTDGGQTWSRTFTGYSNPVTDLVFVTARKGWARIEGLLLHTTDGGEYWENFWAMPDWPVSAVAFADSLHGFVIARHGLAETNYLWITGDGGESWTCTPDTLQVSAPAIDLAFADAENGWLVAGPYILHYNYPLAAGSRPSLAPTRIELSAWPNPFNPATVLAFDVPVRTRVHLSIYDVTGRLVRTLSDQIHAPGSYRLEFDGAALPSGIYFARLQGQSFSKTQKLVLLK